VVNSRLMASVAERLLGREGWLERREQWGLGRSLLMVAARNDKAPA
jgi:hypothetical protein